MDEWNEVINTEPIVEEEINLFSEKEWKEKNCVQYFLTYAKANGLTREKILDTLKRLCGIRYESCIISEEEHEKVPNDKFLGIHFHVYLKLNKKLHLKKQDFFDIPRLEEHWYVNKKRKVIKKYHPNIQSVKSQPAVIRYVVKSDINPLIDNFDLESYLDSIINKKGYGFGQAAKAIKQGVSYRQLDEQQPQFVMNHKRKIEEYIELQESWKRQDRKDAFVPLIPPVPYTGPCQILNTFYDHVNDRMSKPYSYGDKHTYVYGKTGVGKSNIFSEQLPKVFNGYKWIYGSTTGQGIELLTCDYIYLDEFKGQIKPDELIDILNQDPQQFWKIKYGKPQKMSKRVHVFINAQHDIKGTYKNVGNKTLSAIRRRLKTFELVSRIIKPDEGEEDESSDDPLAVDLSFRQTNNRNNTAGYQWEQN